MRGATLLAQAKLNIFLRVLGRDVSGFHSLETLFQRLEIGDLVRVRVDVSGRSLDCRGADVGPVERNLAWRAALLYAEAAGWPDGFAIEIEKHIPVGGGLGGGSADAGAVLRILDWLAPAPLGEPALLELSVALGADVPFLASGAVRALAWGRGERLLSLPPLPSIPAVLLLPSVGVATADAFRWFAAGRAGAAPGGPELPLPRRLALDDLLAWRGLWPLAWNDLEQPVAARVPEVAEVAELRRAIYPPAGSLSGCGVGSGGAGQEAGAPAGMYAMTGSGSTWFALGSVAESLLGGQPPVPALPSGVRLMGTRTAANVVEPAPFE